MALRIVALLAFAASLHAEYRCHWSPMHTDDTQALNLSCANERGLRVPLAATVEATDGNQQLPTVTGTPDPVHRMMPAPIGDIRTYRITRLVLNIKGERYVIVKPEQNFSIGPT